MTISVLGRYPLARPRVRGLDDAPAPGEKAPLCAAPDPAMEPFSRREHEQRDLLAARLHGDPQLRGMLDRWATLTVQQKLELARQVSRHMGEVFGFAPAPLTLVSDEQADGAYGQYDSEAGPIGRIELNVTKMRGTSAKVMFDFLDTVVHEQTHRYQDDLVRQLKGGRLAAGDLRLPVARALAKNDEQYHEASDNPRKERMYRCQISERHAWNNGTGTITRLLKLRSPRFEAVG